MTRRILSILLVLCPLLGCAADSAGPAADSKESTISSANATDAAKNSKDEPKSASDADKKDGKQYVCESENCGHAEAAEA